MNRADDYDKYLGSLHAQKETPEEIIESVIKEGTGKKLVSKQKIIAGEVNEVYDIVLGNGSHVILRVSPNGSPDFQQEQWAVSKCKKVGVPVPNIHLIKYLMINGKEYGFCVMEKVEGDSLERGGIDFEKLSLKERKNYIHQAGEYLAKIHSISTTGWGWIVVDRGQYDTIDVLFAHWLEKKGEYEKIAKKEGVGGRTIQRALAVVEEFKGRYKKVEPHLVHGDYSHKHFMVKEGQITGILDWGGVRSDSPVYDFANWDFWFGENIPTSWLKEGYTNKELFDDDFEDFLHFIRVEKGLENLSWYHKQGYREMVEKIKLKVAEDIKYFQ